VRVGDISKVGRGKHTTSWVELLPLDDTYVVDAPGFSLLEMPAMNPWDIQRMFPEIETTAKGCFFSDCLHLKEPSCAVKEAVKKGLIAESRYNSKLVPSLLSADLWCLKDQLDALKQYQVDTLHVDVMDGNFVPNIFFSLMFTS